MLLRKEIFLKTCDNLFGHEAHEENTKDTKSLEVKIIFSFSIFESQCTKVSDEIIFCYASFVHIVVLCARCDL